MAYVLHHWPRPAIERHLLRSLLSSGGVVLKGPERKPSETMHWRPREPKANKRISFVYKEKLRMWERDGRIRRDDEWIHILDRDFFAEAASRLLLNKALWLAEVVRNYRSAPIDPELRRRELLTFQALMEGRDVHHSSGKRAVRLLPRGRTL